MLPFFFDLNGNRILPIYFSKASAHELFPKWSDEIRAVTSGQVDIKRLVVACEWDGTAQSYRLRGPGWTDRRSNPCRGQIFRTRPERSWGPQPPIKWVPGLSRGKAKGA